MAQLCIHIAYLCESLRVFAHVCESLPHLCRSLLLFAVRSLERVVISDGLQGHARGGGSEGTRAGGRGQGEGVAGVAAGKN